jgi:hypothetical protein
MKERHSGAMIFLPAVRAVFHMRQVYPEIVVAIFAMFSP